MFLCTYHAKWDSKQNEVHVVLNKQIFFIHVLVLGLGVEPISKMYESNSITNVVCPQSSTKIAHSAEINQYTKPANIPYIQ
jgi:hypothetical protein